MQFSRNLSILLNFILNDLFPPVIRDSRLLMAPLFKLAFGNKSEIFLNFRERSLHMTDEEYKRCYQEIDEKRLVKETDLNQECLKRIPAEISGTEVLEIGCGRGVLASLLAENHKVTATDIVISPLLPENLGIKYIEAQAEDLPFEDNSFETVICTHVLEHVRDIDKALSEIRRVAKNRILIVVPKERPYKFGFNLHLTFFPYEFSVLNIIAKDTDLKDVSLALEGGDWFYTEDAQAA